MTNSRGFRRLVASAALLGLAAMPFASADPGDEHDSGPVPRAEVESPDHMDAQQAQFAMGHGLLGDHGAQAHLAAATDATKIATLAGAGAWREMGPKPYHTESPAYGLDAEGFTVVGGRIAALITDPANGNIVYAGAAGGGVWKSTDGGSHWQPISDQLPSLAIGALALDAATHTLFAGTGEANVGQDNFAGTGIYRTRDDGATWERVTKNIADASAVSRIEIAGGRIFVATNKGLYRSTDGGDSYEDVLLPTGADGKTPATTALGNVVSDVRIKPGTPNEITAAVGWRKGKKGGATGAGLYRSTTGGAPGSFTKMAPVGFGAASATNDPIGRTTLAYAHGDGQNHNILWAVIEDPGAENGDYGTGVHNPTPAKPSTLNGVYRSDDDGQTWLLKGTPATMTIAPGGGQTANFATYGPGIQAWYAQWVEVDPFNADRVLVGLEEVFQTIAGANTPGPAVWNMVGRYWNFCTPLGVSCSFTDTGPYGGHTLHPDHHAAVFAAMPNGQERLYEGNDGGVYRQDIAQSSPTGFDNSKWVELNDTLGTTQPYYADMSADGTIYAGFQDNGTVKIQPNGRADEVMGGDGFDAMVEPDNPKHAYAEVSGGAISKTLDGGVNWTDITPSTLSGALFSTPFNMDPLNKNHLLLGANAIHESTSGINGGSGNWKATFQLGTDTKSGGLFSISAIGVRGTPVYVGYCGACDPVTDTTGTDASKFNNGIATNVQAGCTPALADTKCWHKAKAEGLPQRYISGVAIDPTNDRTVYVTLAGYARRWYFPNGLPNAGRGHVFVSHDAGDHFSDISANLPDTPTNGIVVRNGMVIVGTDVGVFAAPVTGGAFSRVGTGLPNAYVLDVRTNPQGTTLIAATHGRGVWTLDIAALSASAAPVVRGTGTTVAAAGAARLPATGTNENWLLGMALLLIACYFGGRTITIKVNKVETTGAPLASRQSVDVV